MSKYIKKILTMIFSVSIVLSSLTISANADSLEGRYVNAYLAYSDANQIYQISGSENVEDGVLVTPAVVTGNGEYYVSLDFSGSNKGPAEGVSDAAIVLDNGYGMFPGAIINLKEVKINDETVETGKGYTYSSDGKELRFNLYNADITSVPEDALCIDGNLSSATSTPVSSEAFSSVEKIEVLFEILNTDTLAYIAFEGSDAKYSGTETAGINANNTFVTGNGSYTVSLEFANPVNDISLAEIVIDNLEKIAPKATVTLNEVKINGTDVPFGNFYAYSDDGISTKLDLYNEAVSEMPSSARRYDDDLAGATSKPVLKEYLADVKSLSVSFTVAGATPVAYIMYADTDWSVQYWNADFDGVTPVNAVITGEGQYTVSLNFEKTRNMHANGCAFAALGILDGENLLPGWNYNIDEVKINGEPVPVDKYFTSSDDGITTRVNLYNEWVSEIPADARRADGDLENVTSTPVAGDLFGEVTSVEVTFTAVWGPKPIIVEEEPANVEYSGEYGAYLGCQTNTDLWIFRNEWSDEIYGGINNSEFFNKLTDSEENTYEGTFTDAVIEGDGLYTVSLSGADFADEDSMSRLFVSTDIPYSDAVSFSEISVKINGNEVYSCDEGYILPENKKNGKYLAFHVQDNFDVNVKKLFEIDFPVTDIEISFRITGLGYEAEVIAEEPKEEEPVASVETSVETTVEKQSVSNIPIWVWIAVGVVAIGTIVVVVIVCSKDKTKESA